jgi:hypothetical protein
MCPFALYLNLYVALDGYTGEYPREYSGQRYVKERMMIRLTVQRSTRVFHMI